MYSLNLIPSVLYLATTLPRLFNWAIEAEKDWL
uniref:Uncharacterized protein n=1 Tax=Lepeophtheirus salmonis TaxID=72036 RepID=A0A0K2TKK8_LEPSM